MLTTILVAIIGAAGSVVAAYIIYRTNRQDKTLAEIKINVNSRLDRLLDQSRIDNTELESLRGKDNRIQPRLRGGRRSTD